MTLVAASIFWTSAPCRAQFLPMKQQESSEMPRESEQDSNRSGVTTGDSNSGEDVEVPPWERRFIQTLDSIDEAIATAERSLETLEVHSENPIVERDELRQVHKDFATAVGSPTLNVHMELTDIRPGKSINRRKQFFELVLQAPDFPAHAFYAEVNVMISPADARRLKIGSVIRLDGQLMRKTRKSFDEVYFLRASGQRPQVGSEQTALRRPPGSTSLGKQYVFPFFVENAQMLAGKPLESYREFKSRYEQRLSNDDPPLTKPERSDSSNAPDPFLPSGN